MIYDAVLVRLESRRYDGRRIQRVTIGDLPLSVVGPDGRRVGAVAEVTLSSTTIAGVVLIQTGAPPALGVEPVVEWHDRDSGHAVLDGVRLVDAGLGADVLVERGL